MKESDSCSQMSLSWCKLPIWQNTLFSWDVITTSETNRDLRLSQLQACQSPWALDGHLTGWQSPPWSICFQRAAWEIWQYCIKNQGDWPYTNILVVKFFFWYVTHWKLAHPLLSPAQIHVGIPSARKSSVRSDGKHDRWQSYVNLWDY